MNPENLDDIANEINSESHQRPTVNAPQPRNRYAIEWDDVEVTTKEATPASGTMQKETPAPAENKEEGPGAPAPTEIKKPVTDKEIQMGADITVDAIDFAVTVVCTPLLRWRFNKHLDKNFSKDDLLNAKEMVADDITPTDPREERILKKFKRYLREFEQKIKEVPFSEDETAKLNHVFQKYYKATEQTLDPKILLYAGMISIIGPRMIDVVMWDN
jgi:hypothetical protein